MKKIEVREYAPLEQLVIVYELDKEFDIDDDIDVDNDESYWNKVDLFDPMLKYDSNCNVGYKGEGPSTLARIIVDTFKDYSSSTDYIIARNKVEEYLSKLDNENNNKIKKFTIIENDIKHLL
jgi:hypothetical protein